MLARREVVLLDRLFRQGTIAGLGEADLLARFVSDRDDAAFAALVDRHGPMVLGVCRRMLRNDRDAEDAFQATFLVLARRAGAIRDGNRLGGWLHGVARKVASRAKARRFRRWRLETNGVDPDSTPSRQPADEPDDWKGILDDELARLPETQRIPLVLCYLEGMTHDEAAARLGWPVGTVRSRMARGRDRLRVRLSRRGFDAETPMPQATAVPPALLEATISAALNFTAPSMLAGTAASAAALANGSLHAMMLSKSATIAMAGLAAAAALVGGPLLARQIQEGGASSVRKSIDKLQADLVETARRNARMQQELQTLRQEIESLRGTGEPPTAPDRTVGGVGITSGGMPGMMGGRGMTPGGMGGPGEMGAMAGLPMATATSPQHYRIFNDWLLVISPSGDRMTMYEPKTGKTRPIRLRDENQPPVKVQPVDSEGLLMLDQEGPNITRTAVFVQSEAAWHATDLEEAVDSTSPTIVSGKFALVETADHLYLWNGAAKRWDPQALPRGTPRPRFRPDPALPSVTYETGGHIYTYDFEKAKWEDFDTRELLGKEESDGIPPGEARKPK